MWEIFGFPHIDLIQSENNNIQMNRKEFLKKIIVSAATLITIPTFARCGKDDPINGNTPGNNGGGGDGGDGEDTGGLETSTKVINFGLCTDVHQDYYPGMEDKIKTFAEAMNKEKVNFVIDLGDFVLPKAANDLFLANWNLFNGPRYNVIGNHDCEYSSKSTWMDYVNFTRNNGERKGYYSFDVEGFHFVVLDLNYGMMGGTIVPFDTNNGSKYDSRYYINEEQLKWLKNDLEKTNKRTILFSHEVMPKDMKNFEELRSVIKDANKKAQKVIAAFSGHWHVNRDELIDGVQHITLNSMAGYYVDASFNNLSIYPHYGTENMTKYVNLKRSIPYNDPLFAMIELDPVNKKITVKGTGPYDNYIGDSPEKLGVVNKGVSAFIPTTTYHYK